MSFTANAPEGADASAPPLRRTARAPPPSSSAFARVPVVVVPVFPRGVVALEARVDERDARAMVVASAPSVATRGRTRDARVCRRPSFARGATTDDEGARDSLVSHEPSKVAGKVLMGTASPADGQTRTRG